MARAMTMRRRLDHCCRLSGTPLAQDNHLLKTTLELAPFQGIQHLCLVLRSSPRCLPQLLAYLLVQSCQEWVPCAGLLE
eukprot:11185251-Lingulodinium_polyedra.AAC.1